ncbi:D-alanyl-D-alanine carboxypeptidase family protein [Alkalilacustris brevis]|uniref:D-alanyl-D-alanine carboxypeptidase family protein n=1 Tax=Alkalilacustris brevis TaxID=2026338 RepID=UPI001EE3D3D0|nr:D-alanyl-D-alanine carboxypeptidase family protein [Alkalilacustris brevis]
MAGILFLAILPVAATAAPYAAMVIDARSGEILHARNHDTRLHPASLTKMMTLYITFEAVKNGEISLDTPVRVSANAAAEVPSKLGLRAGQTISLRYLIRAAALRSANDAATAIGEAIEGSEAAFAARMTRTARAMGMNDTTFRNAHGLTHPEHLSTARDMTTLARQLFFDHPEYYNLFSRRSDSAGIAVVRNTNWRLLDNYRGADGIKTGYTRAAGYNLVGSAERGGKRVIATIFGSTSVPVRTRQMMELLDMGFGRAPVQVAVRRPPPPDYTGTGSGSQPAGRTIRVSTVVSRSPVPPLRPAPAPAEPPEEMLLALQDGIGAALAEAQNALDAPEDTAEAVIAAAIPAPRPDDLVEQLAEIGTEARDTLAEQVAQQDPDVPDDSPAAADVILLAASDSDISAFPEPRPEELATRAVAFEDEEGAEFATAGLSPVSAEALERAVALAAASPTETAPALETVTASDAPPQIILTSSVPPTRPDTDLIIAARPTANDATPEVGATRVEMLTRQVSTSDPRLWGINVGRYGSRFEAERVLMQTALTETGVLDGALRKVSQGSGGFDANFMGLSREQADLACRRLQARDRLCFTLSP